ncbi:hypothetical protein SAMN05443582_101846 [Phyllobacterium sp. OV277]|nr:hypothetical protein SAMN05443582_101846 [Phyllobacterium sp. OV277]
MSRGQLTLLSKQRPMSSAQNNNHDGPANRDGQPLQSVPIVKTSSKGAADTMCVLFQPQQVTAQNQKTVGQKPTV